MVPWRASEEGYVTPALLDWYGRFADGRPGAIVVEATGIRDVPSGPLLRIGHDRYVDGLRQLVDTVRERSGGETGLLIQLIDFLSIRRRPDRERYLQRFLELRPVHRERLSALRGVELGGSSEVELRAILGELSDDALAQVLDPRELEDLERGARERITDTHLPHIAELPRTLPALFSDAAERAHLAGFDGVELHYAHAYTMASFLSRRNDRDDGYGGSREGRLRLPLEVFRSVRERVGEDFCVGCRFLGDEVIEGGSRIEDACEYAEAFARAGMDFLSVSVGGKFEDAKQPKVGAAAYPYTGDSGHACMPTVLEGEEPPFGRNLHYSRAIRERVRAVGLTTPVVGAGGLNDFEQIEAALQGGDCDLAAAARQSLADPDWWRKVALGVGEQVLRCKYTNYCEALDQRHKEVTCQLWDRDRDSSDFGGRPALLAQDGKRRLSAPPWTPPSP
jgi:2,4-dienoyl-CoA reductase-like NADH-dependent reductase (Old Yellow Enzyme family)